MGIFSKETIKKSFKETDFVLSDNTFIFAKLKYDGLEIAREKFNFSRSDLKILSIDQKEITLILPKDEVDEHLNKYIIEKEIVKSIYCDTHKDYPTCTGYLWKILECLSPEDIGVYVFGAYRSDHILVATDDAQKALKILRKLKKDSSS